MAIWISTRPTVNDRWADVDDVISDNWQAYGQATSAEHGTLGSTASGRHFGYAPGTCYYGSTTEIAALTSPPCGALAYDSTVGYLKRYWNSAWAATTSAGRSRARWYLSANNSMGSVDGNTQTVGLSFTSKDGVNFDTYSEFACGKGAYIASADGYYLFNAQVTMASSALRGISSAASATEDIQTGFSKPTMTVYGTPSADGTAAYVQWTSSPTQTAGDVYKNVDDGTTPDTADYIYTSTANESAAFAISRPAIDGTPTNTVVTVGMYCKRGSFASTVSAALLMTNGARSTYSSFAVAGTTYAWQTLDASWTTNPNTSSAWTEAELEGTDATNGISGIVIKKATALGTPTVASVVLSVTYDLATHTEYIREYPVPTDTSFLSALVYDVGASNKTDTYSASGGWGTIPALAQNISASVWIRAKSAVGNAVSAGAVLRLNDTVNYSGDRLATRVPMCAISQVGFTTYQFPFSLNPRTGAAWTYGQINGATSNESLTGFGFYTSGTAAGGQELDISQAHLVVDWENPDPQTTLDVWKYYAAGATSAIAARGRLIQPQVGVMRNDTVRAMGVTPLTAGGHLTCWVTKTLDDDTILSGTDKTFLAVHRMGSSCL
jgi:hypothetical protein